MGNGGSPHPRRVYTFTHGIHDAGCLQSQLGRKLACLHDVLTLAEHDLRTVQADGFHPETDFSWAGRRLGKFVQLKNGSISEAMKTNDIYRVRHVLLLEGN